MAIEWNRLDGVKALVESRITSLPNLYIKPEEQRTEDDGGLLHELDVIDLAEAHHATTISKIKNASQQFGFFQVVNHGVDMDLMNQMLGVSHQFFEMPLHEKMKLYTEDIKSPVRYGTSHNPLKEKALDWCDFLFHRFMAENKGVPHPWPEYPPAYRKIAEKYVEQVCSLAKRINNALSQGLELDEDYLEHAFGDHHVALRLNYYPPCPEPELALGLSGHSDIGGVTVLLQDNIPGLQVKLDDKWKTVKPIPGALVINIGDQLQIFSNGMYRSVEHRAIVNNERTRVSVGVFWDPAADVMVAPIPHLVDENHPACYAACLYEEYIFNLYSKSLVGKNWVESQKLK